MLFTLAWRNIWRNKRRTYITAASVLFAVLFAAFMQAIQRGAWDHMVNNVVNAYFGYAQIHGQGYWEEQTIDKSFEIEKQIQDLSREIPQIQSIVPRVESFALASYGTLTMGVLVIGIQPELEKEMTRLESRLVAGQYLDEDEKAVLIGKGIAENMHLEVGDTLVLISQGYHGVNAAGKYPIKGLVNFGAPELNKQMVYLPLKEAQWFYGTEQRVTSLALKIDDPEEVEPVVRAVKASLDEATYEVMDWKELIPDLVEAKEVDTAGSYLVLLLLYVIISFGIFGTILMMTKEREYEFGVLIAIGMNRFKLAFTVWLEILMLGLVGAVAGILLSIPLVAYFHVNPIRFSGKMAEAYEKFGVEPVLPAAFDVDIFLLQALVVFLITTVLAVYPLLKIRTLQPMAAMRN